MRFFFFHSMLKLSASFQITAQLTPLSIFWGRANIVNVSPGSISIKFFSDNENYPWQPWKQEVQLINIINQLIYYLVCFIRLHIVTRAVLIRSYRLQFFATTHPEVMKLQNGVSSVHHKSKCRNHCIHINNKSVATWKVKGYMVYQCTAEQEIPQ